jgi:hypothetical protein
MFRIINNSQNTNVLINTNGISYILTAGTQIADTTSAQTFTNKTLTSPAINIPNISRTGDALTLPAEFSTIVDFSLVQTITNKTFTILIINSPTINIIGALILSTRPTTISDTSKLQT